MNLLIFFSLFFASPLTSDAVKVNLQGSLSLGQDVMDTISEYLRSNYDFGSGRRMNNLNERASDTIAILVNSAFLCRDIHVCQGTMTKYVNEYVITLAKVIESIFEGLIQTDETKYDVNHIIFEVELKNCLIALKKLLNHADKIITNEDERFVWTDLTKRINAMFQERAMVFAANRLQGNVKEISDVKQKLTQKIVIDCTVVELEYALKLCNDYRICIQSYEVTKALNNFLEKLLKLPEEQMRLFIRFFHEALPDTSFFYRISETTAAEFQAILTDMAYAKNIHTKNVLRAVQKTVETRLVTIEHQTDNTTARDVKLVNIILSDIDHFYSQHGTEPFNRFLDKYYQWVQEGGKFNSPLRQLMKDISNTLSLESDELVTKLVNEVRVFLEFTVDPEK